MTVWQCVNLLKSSSLVNRKGEGILVSQYAQPPFNTSFSTLRLRPLPFFLGSGPYPFEGA